MGDYRYSGAGPRAQEVQSCSNTTNTNSFTFSVAFWLSWWLSGSVHSFVPIGSSSIPNLHNRVCSSLWFSRQPNLYGSHCLDLRELVLFRCLFRRQCQYLMQDWHRALARLSSFVCVDRLNPFS